MGNRLFSTIKAINVIGSTSISVILALNLIINVDTFAQNEALRKEVFGYNTSTKDLVEKGRLLLRDEIFRDDPVKVKAIIELMMNEKNDIYTFLTPAEDILLSYWLHSFEKLPEVILLEEATLTEAIYQSQVIPIDNTLRTKIRKKLISKFDDIVKAIEGSSLQPVVKAFLRLHLQYIILDTRIDAVQDALNKNADDFLKNYPGSKCQEFVLQNIRVKYIRSRWSYSLDLATGVANPTDNLSARFTNQWLVGAGVDISYDRWVLFARGSGGTGKTKAPISFGTVTWNKSDDANFELPEVSIGYRTLDETRFIASPFMGVRWASIIPSEDDRKNIPGYSDIGLKTKATPILGMTVDYRFGKNAMYSDRTFQGYKFLRVRYTYNAPFFERQMVGFNGNIHSLTVGIGASFRFSHRDSYVKTNTLRIFKSAIFRNS